MHERGCAADDPVPKDVWLDASGGRNILSVSCCLINSVGVQWASRVNKDDLGEDGRMWGCEGMLLCSVG